MTKNSFTPMKHQAVSLDFLRTRPAVFDMSDPGSGKTLVEILDFDRNGSGNKAMLVLAPKTILETAWANDIKKFAPHLRVSVAYAENREAAFKADADVYVTNIDATTWLAKQTPKFFGRFERMVVDEVSKLKHATSQRSKAAAKIVKHFPIRRILSGTPNSRSITDIWHPVFLLDGGQRLGKSFYGFRNSVCDPVQVGPSANMVQWVDREYAADSVFALLDDITIRHKFEDCVDIPENHSYAVSFRLPPKLRKVYTQMETLNIAELSESKTVTAVNAAIVAGKLLQIASGAVYDEEGNDQFIDSARYELVGELVEARDHSVVFFQWRHQRDALIKEFERRGLRYAVIDGTTSAKARVEAEKFFQGGFYDAILCQPQSAGHGITLTKGCATIWASPCHDTELWKQGLHRVYRTGQKRKTENIVIVAEDTYDERAFENCMGKLGRMNTLLSLFER